jgi:tetratricopeptide (TPR) repeat protein
LHHLGSIFEKIGQNATAENRKGSEPKSGKHLKKAQKYFLNALKLDPNYAPSYNGLGLVYDAFKKRDKALRNFEKALLIDPNNSIYLQNKACCLRKLNMLDESIKFFYKAIKYDSDNCQIYSNLA